MTMDWQDNPNVNPKIKVGKTAMEWGNAIDEPAMAAYGNTAADAAGAELTMLDKIKAMPDAMNTKQSAGGLFGDNMGSTMMGIGSIASAAAGIYNAYNQKKYQDKLFKMEETRVKRETARQDQQQKNYEKVFG